MDSGNATTLDGDSVYHKWTMSIPNPPLTNLGIQQCTNLQKARHTDTYEYFHTHLQQYDIVCASPLIRAMETAYHLFHTRNILIVPYVNE